RLAAKTLFATHYHELTDVEDYLPRVRNFHLAVRERGHEVEYLHKVVPGRAEKSFGIYVAQLAGLPKPVVHRAQELLGEYNGAVGSSTKLLLPAATPSDFTTLIEALAALDINQLTPVEALTKLYELQRQVAAAHKN
ncbi:MAG TPA: DNA mismatch repair protein MutS, partial [Blastocatellia bacterium]|nr:DNA mismatch repair protein MutS [Blastocatellia bacterium]